MGRSACCDKEGLKKGPWTPEEDKKLSQYIQENGHGSWQALPSKAGLQRCGKSCRLRWTNYLRPDIKRGKFSLQEEQTIMQLHALLGNRWAAIATHLPKRTDNEIKNYWNTHLKKRLTRMGIDPNTHKPKHHFWGQSKNLANISHMAQWESARLEAEARLVRETKLMISNSTDYHQKPPPAVMPPPPSLPAPPPSRPPCLDILKVWAWTNPGKDISTMIVNGFVPLSQLDDYKSPTSSLFNGINSSFTKMNYVESLVPCKVENPRRNVYEDEVLLKAGIMENMMSFHEPQEPFEFTYNIYDSLEFSDFTDLPLSIDHCSSVDFDENN